MGWTCPILQSYLLLGVADAPLRHQCLILHAGLNVAAGISEPKSTLLSLANGVSSTGPVREVQDQALPSSLQQLKESVCLPDEKKLLQHQSSSRIDPLLGSLEFTSEALFSSPWERPQSAPPFSQEGEEPFTGFPLQDTLFSACPFIHPSEPYKIPGSDKRLLNEDSTSQTGLARVHPLLQLASPRRRLPPMLIEQGHKSVHPLLNFNPFTPRSHFPPALSPRDPSPILDHESQGMRTFAPPDFAAELEHHQSPKRSAVL